MVKTTTCVFKHRREKGKFIQRLGTMGSKTRNGSRKTQGKGKYQTGVLKKVSYGKETTGHTQNTRNSRIGHFKAHLTK